MSVQTFSKRSPAKTHTVSSPYKKKHLNWLLKLLLLLNERVCELRSSGVCWCVTSEHKYTHHNVMMLGSGSWDKLAGNVDTDLPSAL